MAGDDESVHPPIILWLGEQKLEPALDNLFGIWSVRGQGTLPIPPLLLIERRPVIWQVDFPESEEKARQLLARVEEGLHAERQPKPSQGVVETKLDSLHEIFQTMERALVLRSKLLLGHSWVISGCGERLYAISNIGQLDNVITLVPADLNSEERYRHEQVMALVVNSANLLLERVTAITTVATRILSLLALPMGWTAGLSLLGHFLSDALRRRKK